MTETAKQNMTKLCTLFYGIYAASILLNFSMTTMMAGVIAMLIVLVLTYLKKKEAAGTIFESHLQWMIRTFWIGGGVILPVLTVAASLILYTKIDMTPMYDAISAGTVSNPDELMDLLLQSNRLLIYATTTAFTVPFALWWLRRCWIGYRLLKEGKPVTNITSWL